MAVKNGSFWTLFCETGNAAGEPVYWLLSRESEQQGKKPKPAPEKSKERAARS